MWGFKKKALAGFRVHRLKAKLLQSDTATKRFAVLLFTCVK